MAGPKESGDVFVTMVHSVTIYSSASIMAELKYPRLCIDSELCWAICV